MKSTEKAIEDFTRYLYARLGLGDVTVSNYVGTLRRLLPRLGIRPNPKDVEKLIMEMRRSGASYSHIVNTSLHLERYCQFSNIRLRLGRPAKPKQLIRGVLTEAEITLLLAATRGIRQRAILTLLAYSGMRNKELCALRVEDLDVANQLVHVRSTKTGRDRWVGITPSCVSVLIDYLRTRNGEPDDLLFLTDRRCLPLEPQDLRKMIKAVAARTKITKRVYPHILRHSLATNMLNRGANLLTIKEQLGHAYVSTTMIYLHSVPARAQLEYRMFAPSYT